MKSTVSVWLLVGAVLGGTAVPLHGASSSYYTLRPEDAKAVYLTRNDPSLHGDGVGDDSDVIQQAINNVQETTAQGILFIPQGLPPAEQDALRVAGIRLIGYGAHRLVFVLGKDTPGYQEGMAYVVMFTGGRPTGGALPRRPGRPARPVVGMIPRMTKSPMPILAPFTQR